uniref:Uncharacterized protein n=1 Tax=Strigamia maritima TaxID=126957 RepID=T1ISM0_STRMM
MLFPYVSTEAKQQSWLPPFPVKRNIPGAEMNNLLNFARLNGFSDKEIDICIQYSFETNNFFTNLCTKSVIRDGSERIPELDVELLYGKHRCLEFS